MPNTNIKETASEAPTSDTDDEEIDKIDEIDEDDENLIDTSDENEDIPIIISEEEIGAQADESLEEDPDFELISMDERQDAEEDDNQIDINPIDTDVINGDSQGQTDESEDDEYVTTDNTADDIQEEISESEHTEDADEPYKPWLDVPEGIPISEIDIPDEGAYYTPDADDIPEISLSAADYEAMRQAANTAQRANQAAVNHQMNTMIINQILNNQ